MRVKVGIARRLCMSWRRDVMDCLWDDDLMKQWDEFSKDEEKINVKEE